MLSDRLQCCRWLMFVVLLAPVYVQPKGMQVEKNEWTNGEAKSKGGRFDNLVEKNDKKKSSSANSSGPGSTYDPFIAELDNDPLAAESASAVSEADNSTSEGTAAWVWAVLGTLCIAGGGLAGFGYYWSRTRNASAW